MLNVVLKDTLKMIYIPDEESVKEYLKSRKMRLALENSMNY